MSNQFLQLVAGVSPSMKSFCKEPKAAELKSCRFSLTGSIQVENQLFVYRLVQLQHAGAPKVRTGGSPEDLLLARLFEMCWLHFEPSVPFVELAVCSLCISAHRRLGQAPVEQITEHERINGPWF